MTRRCGQWLWLALCGVFAPWLCAARARWALLLRFPPRVRALAAAPVGARTAPRPWQP